MRRPWPPGGVEEGGCDPPRPCASSSGRRLAGARLRSLLRGGGSLLSVLVVLLNLMQVRTVESRLVQFYHGYIEAATSSLQDRISPRDRLWPMGVPFPEA